MFYKYECEKCNWKGDEPNTMTAHEFLGVDEEDCEEEYIETCPKCGKLALTTR